MAEEDDVCMKVLPSLKKDVIALALSWRQFISPKEVINPITMFGVLVEYV